jgi:feruloyl-CoA synthase
MTRHENGGVRNLFAEPRVETETRTDGSQILRSGIELGSAAPNLASLLVRGAHEHPERTLVAERAPDGTGWRSISWGEALAVSDSLAQSLLDHDLSAERPLMILSGNGVEHLLLTLAAFSAGVPVMPISTAYSLMAKDAARICLIAERCHPGAVFAGDATAFGGALGALRGHVPIQLVSSGVVDGCESLEDWATTTPTDVMNARAMLTPDAVAKILFTSGSTGDPKGVINTHRMLCANQQSLGQIWPFLHQEPPVLVDWLPWSHTFGGNHNLNQILAFGGTLYVDPGRPAPGAFNATVAALREIAPTVYYNVPAGWALLAPALEDDAELRASFLSRLRLMFYAAAALPEALWDRLRAIAQEHADHEIPLTASWGCTESSPAATSAHFRSARCGCIGVPMPGVDLKLVPDGDKQEIRLRGPSITPGYFRDAQATTDAFDEEGFYRTGDAVRLVDPSDPAQGLMFDGRLSEDFKLVTGTWVRVGGLRTRLLSETGILRDAVICGEGRDRIAAVAWLDDAAACRALGVASVSLEDAAVYEHLAAALASVNGGVGSSQAVHRILLLDQPPSIEAGEITDKGYINQRAVLSRRAAEVEALYATSPGERVAEASAAVHAHARD